MQVDLDRGALPGQFRSEFCIVGGGIAWLLLASRIGKCGGHVHLLDAGGLELENRSQELYEAISLGKPHTGITEGRFRAFGGSSTRWGGQLLPYTEDVLAPPTFLEMPQWPIATEDIAPYYEEVPSVLGASSIPFGSDLLRQFGQVAPFDSQDVRLRFSKWAPFSRRNLAKTLGAECLKNGRITIYLHANVVSVRLNSNGKTVLAVEVKNYGGEKFVFRAGTYVICTGTIESSRLLLASTSECRQGVGNEFDQVGQYFHDHVGVHAADFSAADHQRIVRCFIPWIKSGTLHTAKLEATRKLRERLRLFSVMVHFPIEEPEDSGVARLRNLLRCIQRGKLDDQMWFNLTRLPAASLDIARVVYSAKVRHRRRVSWKASMALHLNVKQKPDAESRVMLSDESDALGVRKAVVQWKISQEKYRTVREYAGVVDHLLRESFLVKPCWNRNVLDSYEGFLTEAKGTYHMMGGTRMGTDPKHSVVDSDLKVHGIDNLHVVVVSCSVFPTGGSSNPTFTMMALALRKAAVLTKTIDAARVV